MELVTDDNIERLRKLLAVLSRPVKTGRQSQDSRAGEFGVSRYYYSQFGKSAAGRYVRQSEGSYCDVPDSSH